MHPRGPCAGANNIDADPLFVDADGADNIVGTGDDDLHVWPGSPCIDAGDPSFLPGPPPADTDIDGQPRIMACFVDMGADEIAAGDPNSGDMDASGAVELPDVGLFVNTLLGDGSAADVCVADMNNDGMADGLDTQSFLDCLLAGAVCP